MNWKILPPMLLVSFLTGCGEEIKKGNNSDEEINYLTALGLEPSIKKTDSLQFLFYKNVDGDEETYTRYYSHYESIDTNLVGNILAAIDQPFQELIQPRKCRSEGKIYLFERGDVNPIQTVYFSGRCDSCCYLYYIRQGKFYYVPLLEKTRQELIDLSSRLNK